MIEVPDEFTAFLQQEYDRCVDQTLGQERETAIDRYNGEPYGDEEEGSSQVVARDVAETIDYMTISVLRTLVSGERIVEFTHQNAEMAHEATEAIMYLLMEKQDGYRILHDWLKAGLLEKNAVAMTYPEMPQPKRKEHTIPALLYDPVKHIEAEDAGTDPNGEPLMNVVEMLEQQPRFCDDAVPNEEFYCSPDARTITEAPMKGRKVRKTISDLIAMGFDREEVEAISSDIAHDNTLSQSRDEDRFMLDARTGNSRSVWWHEEFVKYDLNDDGIAELLYVRRSADFKIFAIEEMEDEEDHPFEDWSPFPMQHRRVGQSLAEKVMDIERIRTVLMRQSLNGIYLANNPSTYLHEDSIGENTIEDLLTVRPGRLIRYRGNVPPAERSGNFDPGAGFQMLEFMNRERETRTGITRLNMGLDESTLNDTAKGQAQLIARGEQVEEYVSRNFANAVAKLITKKARLLQRYGKPIIVPIDGTYKQIDPSRWPEDMIASAKVGLGSSRRDARLAFRREIAGMQVTAYQSGLGLVDAQSFYNSAKGFIADTGIGNVNEFFNEPPKGADGKPIPQPAKPDPEMQKAQMQARAKQMELQARQQESQAKLQMQFAEGQQKLELMRQQGASQAQLDAQKLAFEQQMAQARMQSEAQLAIREQQMNAALKAHEINTKAQGDAQVAKFRQGGKLDA